jgi:hypothetical protein
MLKLFTVALAGMLMTTAVSAKPPATWDGLIQVPSTKLDVVYLQPSADFRGYTKVMLDPTEVAFEKNWMRDYNRSASFGSRISERDLQDAVSKAVTEAGHIFAEAWRNGGYEVVTAPGPDVLRVKTGVINIKVSAPDMMTAGRSHSFANEAGSAALFVEARDSTTGALLGRAIDQKVVGDNGALWRTAASNRADFHEAVVQWARAGVRGMEELKARSPISQ